MLRFALQANHFYSTLVYFFHKFRFVLGLTMFPFAKSAERFRALWVKRKRNAMDVVDMIADGMDKKPKVIMVKRETSSGSPVLYSSQI